MKTLLLICATYALFVVQTAVAPQLAIGAIVPNVVFPALAILALKATPRTAVCFAALWGMIYDTLGTAPLGLNVLAFTLLAAVVLAIREHRAMDSFVSQALLVLGIATVGLAGESAIALIETGLPQDGVTLAMMVGCTAVWSAAFGWSTLVAGRLGSLVVGRSGRNEEIRRQIRWLG